MPFSTTCPKCGQSYTLADTQRGKKVRCKECEHVFVAGEGFLEDTDTPARKSDPPSRKSKKDNGDLKSDKDRFKPGTSEQRGIAAPLLIGGGVVLFLVFGCCGGGIWWIYSATKTVVDAGQNLVKSLNPTDIPTALQCLQSEMPQIRQSGATWFANAKQIDKSQQAAVSKALEPLLSDRDTTIRDTGMLALARWGSKDNVPATIKYLEETANSPFSNDAQKNALAALARWKDERALPILVRYTTHGDGGLRDSANKALVALGPNGTREMLKHLHDPTNNLYDQARRALREGGASEKDLLTQTAQDLKEGDLGHRKVALEWLRQQKVTRDPLLRAQIARATAPLLREREEAVRDNSMRILQDWGSKENTPDVVQMLEESLGNPWLNNAQKDALQTLGRWKDERGAPVLVKYLETNGGHGEAENALRLLGKAAESALVKEMNNPNEAMATRCRKLLEVCKTGDKVLLDQVIVDLKTKELARRNRAADWLAHNTCTDEARRTEVSRLLDPLVTDRDNRVMDTGMRALDRWITVENVPTLITLVNDPAPIARPRREWAIDRLGDLRDPRGAAAVASRLDDFAVRGTALRSLTRMGSVAEDEVLKYALNPAKDKRARIEACNLLKTIGTKKSLPGLQMLERDPDRGLQLTAHAALIEVQKRPDRKE